MPKKQKCDKTEISIKGWDWTEISRILGVNSKEEKTLLKKTKKKLELLSSDMYPPHGQAYIYTKEEAKFKINQIRFFVKTIAENDNSYTTPLWEGLYKIEDDSVFINYVGVLLAYMWT